MRKIKSLFSKNYFYFRLLNKLGLLKYLGHLFPLYKIYYFPEKKIGYLPIPKVSCSSIKRRLVPSSDEIKNIHYFYRNNGLSWVENPQDFFIFSFVRNPFDRLVSSYLDKVERKKALNTPSPFDNYLGGFLMKSQNFSDFVKRISHIPKVMQEPHFAPQYHIIYNGTYENGGGDKNRAKLHWKI